MLALVGSPAAWLRWRDSCSSSPLFLRACQCGGAARLRRGARRLDDDGGRAPALDGLQSYADGPLRVAVADRRSMSLLSLLGYMVAYLHHVPRRHLC